MIVYNTKNEFFEHATDDQMNLVATKLRTMTREQVTYFYSMGSAWLIKEVHFVIQAELTVKLWEHFRKRKNCINHYVSIDQFFCDADYSRKAYVKGILFHTPLFQIQNNEKYFCSERFLPITFHTEALYALWRHYYREFLK